MDSATERSASPPLPGWKLYSEALSKQFAISPQDAERLNNAMDWSVHSWAQAVEPRKEAQLVRGVIDYDPTRGRNRGRIILRSDARLPDKVDQATPANVALQVLTQYRARLEVLKENAPDQVTLPGFAITRNIRKTEKAIGTILKGGKTGGRLDSPGVNLRSILSPKKTALVATTVALATAACRGPVVESQRTPAPVETPPVASSTEEVIQNLKEDTVDFPLTETVAKNAFSEWEGVNFSEDNKKFTVESIDVDGDLGNPNGLLGNTYQEVAPDGYVTFKTAKRAGAIAEAVSPETGERVSLPLLLEYDEASGTQRVFGLVPDLEKSDQNHMEFFLTVPNGNSLQATELRLILNLFSNGTFSMGIASPDEGFTTLAPINQITPPTEDPTEVPDFFDRNSWINDLVAKLSSARVAAAQESTATPAPTQTLVPPEPPTQTATLEPVPFSIEQDAPFPAELGTQVIAVRWGEEGSFTISTKDTPYTLTSPVGERPIFDTPEGKEFFFGLLAKAFGYPDTQSYLEAVTSGKTETITLPQFGIQEGPVTLDPSKVSIVFDPAEVNDTISMWFLNREESQARSTGGWTRVSGAQLPEQKSYYKFEVMENGRIVIRIREIAPDSSAIDIIGEDAYYSYKISQAVYMLAQLVVNDGKFPTKGFDSVWRVGEPPEGQEYEIFENKILWELLNLQPFEKYSGPSDFVAGP